MHGRGVEKLLRGRINREVSVRVQLRLQTPGEREQQADLNLVVLKVQVVIIIQGGMNISNPLILNVRAEVFLCRQHGAGGDPCRWAPWPLPLLLRARSPLWTVQSPFKHSKPPLLYSAGALWDRKRGGHL